MPSKPFPAKFPVECANCGEKVRLGDMIAFAAPGSKDKVHSPECPRKVTFNPPGVPTPPPVPQPGSGDAPIYTYHRTWHSATKSWEIMFGVSIRGRALLAIEIAQLDDAAKAVEWRLGGTP